VAEPLNAVDVALYARFIGSASLLAALPGGVWNGVAGDEVTVLMPPYLTWRFVSSTSDDTADSSIEIQIWDMIIVDSDRQPSAAAATAMGIVFTLLEDLPLALTGATNFAIYRLRPVRFQDDDGWWNHGDSYQLWIQR